MSVTCGSPVNVQCEDVITLIRQVVVALVLPGWCFHLVCMKTSLDVTCTDGVCGTYRWKPTTQCSHWLGVVSNLNIHLLFRHCPTFCRKNMYWFQCDL